RVLAPRNEDLVRLCELAHRDQPEATVLVIDVDDDPGSDRLTILDRDAPTLEVGKPALQAARKRLARKGHPELQVRLIRVVLHVFDEEAERAFRRFSRLARATFTLEGQSHLRARDLAFTLEVGVGDL